MNILKFIQTDFKNNILYQYVLDNMEYLFFFLFLTNKFTITIHNYFVIFIFLLYAFFM